MERKNKFINEQKMCGDEKVNDGGKKYFFNFKPSLSLALAFPFIVISGK